MAKLLKDGHCTRKWKIKPGATQAASQLEDCCRAWVPFLVHTCLVPVTWGDREV